MALVKFTESPKVTDTILLEIETPDALGCFSSNPYKVDRVTIYYIERDFLGTNFGEYTLSTTKDSLLADLKTAQDNLCDNPTPDNLAKVQKVLGEIESSSVKSTFYYKDRVVVKTIGTEGFPAWLSTDADNSPLLLGNTGHFTYEWNPDGTIREGDYFLCWTWTPLAAGEKLSAHTQFVIDGDPRAVITIPTHLTPPEKYEVLLDRYLPEVYKTTLSGNDETPIVMDTLNQAIGKGFTFIEDMANQVIDLFDANALHESLLVYLSNLFNVKLRSTDPTLWRRQIKEAIPLYKKKGTLLGLQDAFAQAGMSLNSFSQYWQMVSKYTWMESFKVHDTLTFTLTKREIVLPNDPANSSLWVKRAGSGVYQAVPMSYVSFDTAEDGSIKMTWVANNFSVNPVELIEGDFIRVLYQYREIPNDNEQQLENYVRTLPLADQRDEDSQEYPYKNWNVRLISEDDPLFDILIPVRQPFADNLIFGYIRTEFGYSENIYNMEEYNGSIRPSLDKCNIGKEFLDPCGACVSSKYSVDIGVEELSNDRMLEAQEILREFVPFHAQLHTINFAGEVNEFVQSPVETIETLITIDYVQHILSGNSNPIFNRMMEGGLENFIVDREMLTDQLTVLSGKIGTAYNDHVAIVTPDIVLRALGVDGDGHILEILAPSANAGEYQIDDIEGKVARVKTSVIEPVDESAFTFNLSNVTYGNSYTTILQDNEVALTDESVDFAELGVKSLWDVEHTANYSGGAWKILIPDFSSDPYEINKVTGGIVYLKGDSLLPNTSVTDITYSLLYDNGQTVTSSNTGNLTVKKRGKVDLNDISLVDIGHFIHLGDYLYYNSNEYPVLEFDGNGFWIGDYDGGNVSGVSVIIRRRLVEHGVGYFGYKGLRLITFADHESEFGMINGKNPPPADEQTDNSLFKENFLFLINNEYYKIAEIDKDHVILAGRDQNWMTLGTGGTAVAYSVVHFPAKEVSIGFTVFDQLNRNGKDPVIRELFSTVDNNTAIVALSTSPSSGMEENATQEESISFTIERRDGYIVEGVI
jgi:hypothetical protein